MAILQEQIQEEKTKKIYFLYKEFYGSNIIPNHIQMSTEERIIHSYPSTRSIGLGVENITVRYQALPAIFINAIPISFPTFNNFCLTKCLEDKVFFYPLFFTGEFNSEAMCCHAGMNHFYNSFPDDLKLWIKRKMVKVLFVIMHEKMTPNDVDIFFQHLEIMGLDPDSFILSIPWRHSEHGFSPMRKLYDKNVLVNNFFENFTYEDLQKLLKGANRPIVNGEYLPAERKSEPKKKYVCLNRRYQPNRVKVHTHLIEQDLLDLGYNSMPSKSTLNNIPLSEYVADVQKTFHGSIDLEKCKLYWEKNGEGMTLDKTPIKEIQRNITNSEQLWGFEGSDHSLDNEFADSYLSIICEEYALEEDDKRISGEFYCTTEKTFRPIYYKHMFFMSANRWSLRSLRERGYKTFSDFWDESYDDIKDHDKRLCAMLETATEIIKSSYLPKIYELAQPILEHNYNLFMKRTKKDYINEELLTCSKK